MKSLQKARKARISFFALAFPKVEKIIWDLLKQRRRKKIILITCGLLLIFYPYSQQGKNILTLVLNNGSHEPEAWHKLFLNFKTSLLQISRTALADCYSARNELFPVVLWGFWKGRRGRWRFSVADTCFSKCPDINAVIFDLNESRDNVVNFRMTSTHKQNLLVSDFVSLVSGSRSNPGLPRTPKTAKVHVNVGQISN